jgi:hypothetical protein
VIDCQAARVCQHGGGITRSAALSLLQGNDRHAVARDAWETAAFAPFGTSISLCVALRRMPCRLWYSRVRSSSVRFRCRTAALPSDALMRAPAPHAKAAGRSAASNGARAPCRPPRRSLPRWHRALHGSHPARAQRAQLVGRRSSTVDYRSMRMGFLAHPAECQLTPAHICSGTGLVPPTSALELGSPLPHLHRDCWTSQPAKCLPCRSADADASLTPEERFLRVLPVPVPVRPRGAPACPKTLPCMGQSLSTHATKASLCVIAVRATLRSERPCAFPSVGRCKGRAFQHRAVPTRPVRVCEYPRCSA